MYSTFFETPVYMKSFKMTNFDLQIDIEGQNGYNNISILEVRAYSNDQSETPQGQTLDEVVASIKGTKIAKDVNEFTLPNVPDGFTIESNGADFEQIIGEADKETGKLPVVHPMTDKEVQISFNVTETKNRKCEKYRRSCIYGRRYERYYKGEKCETFGYSGDTGVVFGIRSESVG